jgi:hypothetical protein
MTIVGAFYFSLALPLPSSTSSYQSSNLFVLVSSHSTVIVGFSFSRCYEAHKFTVNPVTAPSFPTFISQQTIARRRSSLLVAEDLHTCVPSDKPRAQGGSQGG